MGSRRTMPAPSLTAPALRHATSASCRHASRSAKKPPPVQPASSATAPTSAELPQYQRLPHAMGGRMRCRLLTVLQRLAAAADSFVTPRHMVKGMGASDRRIGKGAQNARGYHVDRACNCCVRRELVWGALCSALRVDSYSS